MLELFTVGIIAAAIYQGCWPALAYAVPALVLIEIIGIAEYRQRRRAK